MSADNLFVILGMMRAEMPEISDDIWEKLKRGLSANAAGARLYVPAYKKRNHLEAIAEAGEDATAQKLSKMLGVSVRRAQQLKKLNGG